MGKRTHKLTKVKEQLKQAIEGPKQAEEALRQSEELYPKKVEDNDSDKGHGEIVIVDDNPASLNATRRVLRREGYKVVGFTDPEGFLNCNLENTDLILCDILMPKIDGFGVLERVKSDARYQHIPFVFLSGSDVEYRQVAKAFESGASDFISKNCDRGELLGRVRKALKEGRLIAEQRKAEKALRGE